MPEFAPPRRQQRDHQRLEIRGPAGEAVRRGRRSGVGREGGAGQDVVDRRGAVLCQQRQAARQHPRHAGQRVREVVVGCANATAALPRDLCVAVPLADALLLTPKTAAARGGSGLRGGVLARGVSVLGFLQLSHVSRTTELPPASLRSRPASGCGPRTRRVLTTTRQARLWHRRPDLCCRSRPPATQKGCRAGSKARTRVAAAAAVAATMRGPG